MDRYVCPEGDFEQEMPGVCPNHTKPLELVSEDETTEGWEEEEEVGTTGEEQEDMGADKPMDEDMGTPEMEDEEEDENM